MNNLSVKANTIKLVELWLTGTTDDFLILTVKS